MPRAIRVRIATGLVTIVIGFAIELIGPVIALFVFQLLAYAPDPMDPMNLDQTQSALQEMTNMNNLVKVVRLMQIGGLGIALVGFLIAFVTWIRWFVRSDDSISSVTDPVA